MPIWRPRMAATLSVPILGTRAQRVRQEASTEMTTLNVRPRRARLLSNDHNHADELELTLDWTEAGVDPRLLDNAVVTFYLDNADDFGKWTPSAKNCRFIGLAKTVNAERRMGQAASVTIVALDYTTLLLEAKPFGSKGIPDLSQTLREAWRTIILQTPGADVLVDRLEYRGFGGDPKLSEAVSSRFAKLAKVPTHPETDAWAVWQQCCGMLGLISFIELDRCIVTTATNLYTEENPPVLVWGRNLEGWTEERSSTAAGKDVGVSSFDPLTGRTLEAFYRPKGEATKKRPKATKIGDGQESVKEEQREWFAVPGITEQKKLEEVARRIFEERTRQELSGRATTAEFTVESHDGTPFDLVGLKAGDSVQVTVDPAERQLLASIDSEKDQIDYLRRRGYAEDVATLIVKNMANLAGLSSVYFVRSVSTNLELTKEGGSFRVELEYVNRIDIDGAVS